MIVAQIKTKKVKSFKDVSIQMERIITLYYQGYGNERMYEFCEQVYFKLLKENAISIIQNLMDML